MPSVDDQLDDLARRLESRGLVVRNRCYFADKGIFVLSQPLPVEATGIEGISERTVFLYWSDAGWEARITCHGGPHWVRRVASLVELEAVAIDVFATDRTPPTDGWTRA